MITKHLKFRFVDPHPEVEAQLHHRKLHVVDIMAETRPDPNNLGAVQPVGVRYTMFVRDAVEALDVFVRFGDHAENPPLWVMGVGPAVVNGSQLGEGAMLSEPKLGMVKL